LRPVTGFTGLVPEWFNPDRHGVPAYSYYGHGQEMIHNFQPANENTLALKYIAFVLSGLPVLNTGCLLTDTFIIFE
jgi:hypothetical protein